MGFVIFPQSYSEKEMKTTKPKIQRSYVQVRDPDSREMRHVTVYECTPQQVIEKIVGRAAPKPSRRATVPA